MFSSGIKPFSTNTFGNTTTNSNQFFGKMNSGFQSNPSTSFGAQPQPSTSMFSSMQPNLFQSSNPATFSGAAPNQTGFGTSVFGQQPQPSTSGLFTSTPAFGQQTKTFGFGSTATTTTPTLFGQQPQQPAATSLFQSNQTPNLFGSNTGTFGGQPQTGTVIKFSPVTGTDTMQKNGVAQQISTKHHCITCMKEYENKSLEELRFEDYSVNRKGPQGQANFPAPAFGGAPSSSMPTLFDKSTFGTAGSFGQTANTFGINTSNTATNVFGKPPGFGATTTTSNTFGFNAAPSTSTLFGGTQQTKPFTPLFGQTSTQPQQTGFGTNVFGQTTNQNVGTNLFQKPQTTTTGFNTGQTGFTFSAQPQSTQTTNLFQVSKPSTGFSLFNPATSTSGFGTTTQQQTAFGSTFGKPTTTPQFGQTTQQPPFGTNLGTQQQSLFGGNTSKPSLFTNTTSIGLFPSNAFQQQQQQQQPSIFNLQLSQQQPLQLQPQPQQMQFPPESSDITKNLALIATDIFPEGPHTYGLEPILPVHSTSDKSTTNPVELKNILDYSKTQDTLSNVKAKIKVHLPKPKRDPSITKEFFDDVQNYRSNRRTLIIRKRPDEKKTDTVFGNFKNELLEEADRCINKDRKPPVSPESIYDNLQAKSNTSVEIEENKNQVSQEDTTYKSLVDSPTTTTTIDDQKHGAKSSISPVREKVDELSTSSSSINKGTTASFKSTSTTLSAVLDEELSITTDIESARTKVISDETQRSNPTGIILTRPEYYILPTLEDLEEYIDEKGDCIVEGLTIGRRGYGNVYFPDPINVKNLNLDEIIHFRHREVIIYPDDNNKPPIGEGLNRRAQVTLDKVYPREKGTNEYIKDVNKIIESNFVENLMAITLKHNSKFVDYRPETGSWVFKVKHFSKYGVTDSDDEQCEVSTELLALQQKKIDQLREEIQRDIDDVGNIGLDGMLQTKSLLAKEELHQKGVYIPPPPADTSFLIWPEVSLQLDEEELRRRAFIQVMKACIFGEPAEIKTPSKKKKKPRKIEDIEFGTDVLVHPRYYTLNYRLPPIDDKVPLPARCYADLSLFKRKAFNVGWYKGCHFLQYDKVNLGIKMAKCVCRWKINTCDNDFSKMMPDIIDCLKIVHEWSDLRFDLLEEVPTYFIKFGPEYMEKQAELFSKHAKEKQLSGSELYLCAIWELSVALWGYGANNDFERRENFSDWLKKFTYHLSNQPLFKTKQPKTQDEAFNVIFELLTYNRIDEAAELALKFNMNYLALLIGQTGLTEVEKNILVKYITYLGWKGNAIPDNFKKIHLLLTGLPNVSPLNVFQDIDWLRCLGMHLWYLTPSAAPIYYVMDEYRKSFDEVCSAIRPHPPYGDMFTESSNDLLYEILQVYIYNNAYRLDRVLNPSTHTDNPMDYRLSWILYQLFQSVRNGLIDDNEKIFLHTSLATQLEDFGHWDWAIFVLLYIKDTKLKKKLIMRILERNISQNIDTSEKEERLVKMFRLPSKWIYEVKGYQSLLYRSPYETFLNFAYMKNFKIANKILINSIIPELFINGYDEFIIKFIKKIELYRDEIYQWKNTSGLFQEFLEMQDAEVKDDDRFCYEMKFRILCSHIKPYPRKTKEQKLCIAELSKKCAYLYDKLFSLDDFNMQNRFLGVYKQFIMPPDYDYLDVFCDVFSLIHDRNRDKF